MPKILLSHELISMSRASFIEQFFRNFDDSQTFLISYIQDICSLLYFLTCEENKNEKVFFKYSNKLK